MQYHELQVYVGAKESCDHCGRKFRPGEVLTLADGGKLLFCYSDDDGGCLQNYMFFKMKPMRTLFGEPAVFLGHIPDPEENRPDPPRRWWQFWK